jgi:hypothetical protein
MLPHIGIDPSEQEKLHRQFDAAFSDETIDFNTQLNNLWKSQMDLVEQYGSDGLAFLLDHETRVDADDDKKRSLHVVHYTALPQSSPWHSLSTLSPEAAIRKAWEAFPAAFVTTLAHNCKGLFGIFENDRWFLAYAYIKTEYDNSTYYEFLCGSEPEQDAQLPETLIGEGWKMPQDLKAFYAVHGSFGNLQSVMRGEESDCIKAAATLETSLTFLEEHVAEWEADYTFFDLLPFFMDSGGNCQNFYKQLPTDGSYMTVDWDRSTKELTGKAQFADFIDYRFGDTLRGEW